MQNEPRGLVLLIGVLDQIGSTNIPMALSMIKQGFHIIPVNYRTIINKYGYTFFEGLVMNLVSTQKPDLVLVCKGNGIQPSLINQINQYTRTWIYNMDPRPTMDAVPEVRENARIATFSSCTALDLAQEWTEAGANCFYMVQGLDEQIFKPVKSVKKYEADISLIGSKTPMRDEAKEYLENAGYDVKFYGYGYTDKEVLENEFAQVCASSKYMLSMDSIAGQHQHYFSNRLLRYLGCGALTFHFEPTGTLQEYFRNEEDIMYFTNLPNLVNQIRMLDENPKNAYRIAMNGMDKVLKEYTWDACIFSLLSTALPEIMEVQDGV